MTGKGRRPQVAVIGCGGTISSLAVHKLDRGQKTGASEVLRAAAGRPHLAHRARAALRSGVPKDDVQESFAVS